LWGVSEILNIKLTPDNFDHVVIENPKMEISFLLLVSKNPHLTP
jgi:hypothetical protein